MEFSANGAPDMQLTSLWGLHLVLTIHWWEGTGLSKDQLKERFRLGMFNASLDEVQVKYALNPVLEAFRNP